MGKWCPLFIAVPLLLVALMLRLVFFQISTTRLPVVDDEAHAVLIAQQIREGLFPLFVPGQPYEFPVESYALAPVVRLLPRTAFGARLPFLFIWLLAVLGQLYVLHRIANLASTWPGALLILFPSAYLLTFQSAIAWPQYASLALFTWLLACLMLRIQTARDQLLPCALAGVVGGLALSSYALAISVVLAVSAAICLSDSWRNCRRSTFAYLAGLGIGLSPYLLGLREVTEDRHRVLLTRPPGEALSRLWTPTVETVVSGVLGIDLPPFTDYHRPLYLVPGLSPWVGLAFLGILLAATGHRLVRLLGHLRRSRWPTLTVNDVFIAATWVSLIAFAFSTRAHPKAYRYLIPLAWFLPFLLSYLYAHGPRVSRAGVAALAVLLSATNVSASIRLMREWSRPDFAVAHADTPPLEPALRVMRDHGWRYCYAPFWLAHRMAFESHGSVTCTAPYNERFYGWPLPHKPVIDAHPGTPYVLFDGRTIRFNRARFERDLRTMGVAYRVAQAGHLSIYYDFSRPAQARERPVPRSGVAIAASENAAHASRLNDGDNATWWTSVEGQRAGTWLELTLDPPQTVSIIELDYGSYPYDRALSLRILARRDVAWRPLASGVPDRLDPFVFANGHPVYGGHTQTIRFPPVWTDGLRIEIDAPNPERLWQIGEIRLKREDGVE